MTFTGYSALGECPACGCITMLAAETTVFL